MLNDKNSCARGMNYSDTAEFVIEHIKALGLSLRPQSRLMKMYRAMTIPAGPIKPEDSEFETALEAIRDLQVLAFVFKQADIHSNDAEFQHLIKKALKDSVLPQDDRQKSIGRDAQFELFVAAICQNAGMLPVSREEPDVICHARNIKFCIAVKRIKNLARLKTRIREAASQIKKAGLPGFIAIETCVAVNRNNERIITPISDDQFGPLYKKKIKRLVDDIYDNIHEWVYGKGVRGIVIHDQQVIQLNGEWSLVGMTEFVNPASKNNRRKRDFSMFIKQYRTGLPNVTHL